MSREREEGERENNRRGRVIWEGERRRERESNRRGWGLKNFQEVLILENHISCYERKWISKKTRIGVRKVEGRDIGTWIAYVHIATSHGTDYPNFFWIHTNTSKLSTHRSNVIIVQSPIRSYKNQNYYWRKLNKKWTKNNSAEEHLKRSNGKTFRRKHQNIYSCCKEQ